MRIRSTRPEFYRSERVASVSWDARYVVKALESYVDDNGVGKHDMELIVGDLFMRDLVREPSRTLARVSEAISELHEAGLLWLYEADDTRLLYISFWEEIQRIDKPQPGRFRRPDGTLHYKESSIRESSRTLANDSRALAPVTGEQGNRGTGISSSEVADATTDAADDEDPSQRDDVIRICEHLAKRIEGNAGRRPTVGKKWHNAARLMLDRDNYTEAQVIWLIDKAQDDEFWRSNILSMPKLREKALQLRMKFQSQAPPPSSPEHLPPVQESWMRRRLS